jgi:ABC-2 type transport system ATP-binding protein
MMIEVEHLTKNYPGGVTAVRDVSFSVNAGEVVGFLGPNGAGKSTTMRILSGFISPSGGMVRVGGLDVTRDSLNVRRRLGYLPESCPLYLEMRVREFLRYRGELKGVPHRHLKNRVAKVMEQCGLVEVQKRPIGHLSKGFRQRVGIADALVHNPDLLILDEPTIGLDPNQILQIRNLIGELSREHTLLVSTHILHEVEATCDRVIVLQQGQVVDTGALKELEERWCPAARIHMEVRASHDELDLFCRQLPDLREFTLRTEADWAVLDLDFGPESDPREDLFRRVRQKGWDLRELHRPRRTLEEAFVNMTRGVRPGSGQEGVHA